MQCCPFGIAVMSIVFMLNAVVILIHVTPKPSRVQMESLNGICRSGFWFGCLWIWEKECYTLIFILCVWYK